jgi:hypothetical protein
MRKPVLLSALAVTVLVAGTSRCNSIDLGGDTGSPRAARLQPAVQAALAAVATVHDHRMAERGGERVVYHPGWSSRIALQDAKGRSTEIYRQTAGFRGTKPKEVVLGFRDVAIAVFDPNHRIAGITAETADGETWSFAEQGVICPPACPAGADSASTSLMPSAAPVSGARLALAPAERARASVSTAAEHLTVEAADGRVTYHPGWSSRIRMTDAAGASHEIYRQTRIYHGPHPREVALGFRDVGLAVFNPTHRLRAITVQTLTGEAWEFDETALRCPPDCPPADSISTP